MQGLDEQLKQLGERNFPKLAVATDKDKMEPDATGHSVDLFEPLGKGLDADVKLVARLRFLEPDRGQYETYAQDATAKMFAWLRLQEAIYNVEIGNVKDPERAGEMIEGFFKSAYKTLVGAGDAFFNFLKKCSAMIDETPIERERFVELFPPTNVVGTQRFFDANEAVLHKLGLTGLEVKN